MAVGFALLRYNSCFFRDILQGIAAGSLFQLLILTYNCAPFRDTATLLPWLLNGVQKWLQLLMTTT